MQEFLIFAVRVTSGEHVIFVGVITYQQVDVGVMA
jgi:hypothetical protein